MDSNNKNALIIEDDHSIYYVLELILQGKNISSIHAESLANTKALISEVSPDYIFVDHFLPDGLGIDFIPFLRKKYSDSFIVTITAQNSAENKVRAAANGSDYFLEKPFTLADVYRSLGL